MKEGYPLMMFELTDREVSFKKGDDVFDMRDSVAIPYKIHDMDDYGNAHLVVTDGELKGKGKVVGPEEMRYLICPETRSLICTIQNHFVAN